MGLTVEEVNISVPACDICGTRMLERKCKIICPNCGYTRDCSDP